MLIDSGYTLTGQDSAPDMNGIQLHRSDAGIATRQVRSRRRVWHGVVMGVSVLSPVFIGRREEMTALASALQRVREGAGTCPGHPAAELEEPWHPRQRDLDMDGFRGTRSAGISLGARTPRRPIARPHGLWPAIRSKGGACWQRCRAVRRRRGTPAGAVQYHRIGGRRLSG